MPVLQHEFAGSITRLSERQQPSDFVIDPPSLKEVERAFETEKKLKIHIVGKVSLGTCEQNPSSVELDAKGDGYVTLTAKLGIHERELESILTLTRERGGSFSFIGIHHTSTSSEANYNAGWYTNHTYTTYKVTVDEVGKARYEIIDTETSSNRF